MTPLRISRGVVFLASLSFAGLALSIWVAPEDAARRVGVEAIRASGTAMVRADLGGLFAGMAVLCWAAARTRHQPWIVAAGTMLTAIVVGRCLGWIATGQVGGDVVQMAIELGIIAALIAFARAFDNAQAGASACRGPDRGGQRIAGGFGYPERRLDGRPTSSIPAMRALGKGACSAGRDRTAAVMHDIEDYQSRRP